jgi:hypothetical protein
MARHTFNFDGGDDLTTMGASWFVSYLYYLYIDNSHINWNNISTVDLRMNTFNKTGKYYKYWLQQILIMRDCNLNKNKIGLNAMNIKRMAKELLLII